MLLLTLAAPTALADWFSDARAMMGTEVSVHLWSDDPEAGRQALEEVFQEAGRIDRLMSTYKDGSEISKINRGDSGGKSMETIFRCSSSRCQRSL